MDKWHEGEELARFSKSSGEDVCLRVHKFTIGRYLDIRIWTKIGIGDGVPSNPTDRGLMLDVDLLPDLRAAIDKAIVALGGDASAMPHDAGPKMIVEVVHTREGRQPA
jgi:hypothetical protein